MELLTIKMRKGFELIKTRELSDKIKATEIEQKLGFALPPLYKFFIELVETGNKNSFKCDKYYDNNLKEQYYATGIIYEPLKDNEKWFLSVSYFDDIDEVVNNWKSYLCYEKEWIKYKFLRIAGIGQGGGLYVSTRAEDLDVIYQVIWDWEEPYFKVADNIFELMKGFVEYIQILRNKIGKYNSQVAEQMDNMVQSGVINNTLLNSLKYKIDEGIVQDFMKFPGVTSKIYINHTDVDFTSQKEVTKTVAHEIKHVVYKFQNQLLALKWYLIRSMKNNYNYTLGDNDNNNLCDDCSSGSGHELYNPENKSVCNEECKY